LDGKGGEGVFFAGNPSYVIDGTCVTQWLPARFCALLCTFVHFFALLARGPGAILRLLSSILRFGGIIIGRVGPIF